MSWVITKDILSPDPDDDLNSVGVSNADNSDGIVESNPQAGREAGIRIPALRR